MGRTCTNLRVGSAMKANPVWTPPLLRWAGSKRKLLPELMRHVPEAFERYVEPFAGSGCLFFSLRPRKAVLGDINSELIETYRTIAKHPKLVARSLHALRGDKRTYYRLRDHYAPESPVDRATRFVYLNRHCFNGVYRINRAGRFNVPRGNRTGGIPSEAEFYRCSIALRGTELRAGDYRTCLADIGSGDFVYLDPPYASRRRNTHGEYG
jgi:DNA adenine methylase